MTIDARTAEGRKLAPLRRLPDGTVTRSHITYLRMWRRLIAPVEKALGWKWVSFDPGVCFEVGPDGHTASLSVDAINDMSMAIKMRDQEIEQLREELHDAHLEIARIRNLAADLVAGDTAAHETSGD